MNVSQRTYIPLVSQERTYSEFPGMYVPPGTCILLVSTYLCFIHSCIFQACTFPTEHCILSFSRSIHTSLFEVYMCPEGLTYLQFHGIYVCLPRNIHTSILAVSTYLRNIHTYIHTYIPHTSHGGEGMDTYYILTLENQVCMLSPGLILLIPISWTSKVWRLSICS